jgi:hypothetical protein
LLLRVVGDADGCYITIEDEPFMVFRVFHFFRVLSFEVVWNKW